MNQEYGWYHPDWGYWQTISWPSDEIQATYPPGTIQVPLKPMPTAECINWDWIDGAWVCIPREITP